MVSAIEAPPNERGGNSRLNLRPPRHILTLQTTALGKQCVNVRFLNYSQTKLRFSMESERWDSDFYKLFFWGRPLTLSDRSFNPFSELLPPAPRPTGLKKKFLYLIDLPFRFSRSFNACVNKKRTASTLLNSRPGVASSNSWRSCLDLPRHADQADSNPHD